LNTLLVHDINSSGSSGPRYLVSYNSKVVFAANDGVNGEELWESTGTGATMVSDIRVGYGSSFPTGLTVLTTSNHGATAKLFFLAVEDVDVGNSQSAHSWSAETYGMHLFTYDGASVSRSFPQTYGTIDIDKESLDADFPADFGVLGGTLYYGANIGKRDVQVPQGFVGRDLTSFERVHGFDQAFVLFDDDVNYDANHVYEVTVNATKGEIEIVDLGMRASSVSFNGTLKELNSYARRVVFYPAAGENGWADVKVIAKDLINPGDCDDLDACEEQTLSARRSIWITAVNSAPVLTYDGTGSEEIPVGGVLELGKVSVQDDDVGESIMTVEVSCASGKIKVGTRDSITFDGVGKRGKGYESDVKFYGKIDAVNEALADMSYECDGCGGGTTDQITISVSDGGGTGKGGSLSDVEVVQVNVIV
jgi:ELWxxDGT repeat protein